MKKIWIGINFLLLLSCLFLQDSRSVDVNLNEIFFSYSKTHFLGTDHLGRDILSLLIVGASRTFSVFIIASFVSFSFGSFLGLITGYFQNYGSIIIKSIVDFTMIVPSFIVALIVTAIFGINPLTAGCTLGIAGIGNYMNQAENLTKQEKEKEYIQASRVLGVPCYVILYRRILPNILPQLLVNIGNTASGVILQYAALTFIGLGSDFTKPDWGAMLYEYRVYLISRPSLVLLPTICILWLSLSCHFLLDTKKNGEL